MHLYFVCTILITSQLWYSILTEFGCLHHNSHCAHNCNIRPHYFLIVVWNQANCLFETRTRHATTRYPGSNYSVSTTQQRVRHQSKKDFDNIAVYIETCAAVRDFFLFFHLLKGTTDRYRFLFFYEQICMIFLSAVSLHFCFCFARLESAE